MLDHEVSSDKAAMPAHTLATVLADVSLFASADKLRATLNAVRLDVAGGRGLAVATDSYVLGSIGFDCEGSMAALIDVADVKRIVAMVKSPLLGAADVVLEREGHTLSVREPAGGSIVCRLIDSEFPNYGPLFGGIDTYTVDAEGAGEPARTEWNVSAFNPGLPFAKLAKLRLGGKSAPTVNMALAGRLKPAIWYAESNGYVFRGLSMPVRTDVELATVVAGPERIAAVAS